MATPAAQQDITGLCPMWINHTHKHNGRDRDCCLHSTLEHFVLSEEKTLDWLRECVMTTTNAFSNTHKHTERYDQPTEEKINFTK